MMCGRLSPGAVKAFVLAGHAVVTVQRNDTAERRVYKVQKAVPRDGHPEDRATPTWFVKVLGEGDVAGYTYLGIIQGAHFRRTLRSRVRIDAPSFMMFDWLWRRIDELPSAVEVWHAGRCGRCGRTLTEASTSGIGPECATYLRPEGVL